MEFGPADAPGLVVANTAAKTVPRVPVAKNTFQLMKGEYWNKPALVKKLPQGATWHADFGPQMARKGRMSVVVSISNPNVSTRSAWCLDSSHGQFAMTNVCD